MNNRFATRCTGYLLATGTNSEGVLCISFDTQTSRASILAIANFNGSNESGLYMIEFRPVYNQVNIISIMNKHTSAISSELISNTKIKLKSSYYTLLTLISSDKIYLGYN